MKIKQPCVAALTWVLKDTLGEELDVLADPVEFLIGGNDLFSKIEAALQDRAAGESVALQLEPAEAFGEYQEQLIFLERRELFPADLQAGMTIEGWALPAACNPQVPKDLLYTVSDVYPEHVVLDGNHPLAGIALRLQLKVQGVRAATAQEIARGSVGTGFFRVSLQSEPGSGHVQ